MMNLAFQVVGQIQSQQQATLRAVEQSQREFEASSSQNAETIHSLASRVRFAIGVAVILAIGMLALLLYLRQILISLRHRGLPVAPLTAAVHSGNGLATRLTSLLGAGQALLDLKQPARALICFDEVLALDNLNARAHLKKGAALEQLGRLAEAIAAYDYATTLDPLLTDAYVAKGGILNRLERYEEALQCYDHAAHIQPSITIPQVQSVH